MRRLSCLQDQGLPGFFPCVCCIALPSCSRMFLFLGLFLLCFSTVITTCKTSQVEALHTCFLYYFPSFIICYFNIPLLLPFRMQLCLIYFPVLLGGLVLGWCCALLSASFFLALLGFFVFSRLLFAPPSVLTFFLLRWLLLPFRLGLVLVPSLLSGSALSVTVSSLYLSCSKTHNVRFSQGKMGDFITLTLAEPDPN